MPSGPASALVALSLLAASLAPKLWLQRHSAQVDTDRLDRDIAARLEAMGFRTTIDPDGPATAVRAWRPDCRLIARNGDRARELGVVFRLEAVDYGPVGIGYRHGWTDHPAGAQAVLERFVQDGAERIGIRFGRPAVIALARSGTCPGVEGALDGLVAHAALTEPADDADL